MEVKLEVAENFEENEPIPLASFSNGLVDNKASDLLKMTLTKKTGERNPRKRILVGETDRVTYLGTNFETEGGLYTPSYCKYLIGSLNKKTRVMSLHRADVYHMSPKIKGKESEASDTPIVKNMFTRDDYTSTHDKMVQSFGSERAKKAWSAAKRNKMDSSLLDSTLMTALDYADDEMKKADAEEPKPITSQVSSFLPPHNASATQPEDVYKLSDIISDDMMVQLKTPAATLVRATAEDISNWQEKGSRSEFVLSQIPKLPKGGGAYRTASILVYCEYLIRVYCLHSKEVEKNGLSKLHYISEPIQSYLLASYTEQGPTTTGVLTNRMRDKILACLIVLGLMINGYSFDSSALQRDLKVQSTKILEVSRALGCGTQQSEKTGKGRTKHYTVTLNIPLVFSKPARGRKKRGLI